jgi:DNA-binding transcriptional MerR regulator
MSFYSIAQLEGLSGVKAHTIRIWEQRYGLLKPARTDTNIRLYDDEQLRKLLNTTLLINNGVKISKVASFNEKEISSEISKIIAGEKSSDFFSEAIISQMISSGLEFNEINFDKAFSSAILRFGLRDTYIKIIYPLLVRTGLLWSNAGISPCQEHFLTNLIKRKLYTAIDSLPSNPSSKQKWILFLPEEEDHEIGLLFANFILKNAGSDVIYLGQRVPYESLKKSIKDTRLTVLLFFLVRHHTPSILNRLFKNITRDFTKSSVIVSCNQNELKGISLPRRIKNISSIEEFFKIAEKSV